MGVSVLEWKISVLECINEIEAYYSEYEHCSDLV